ncbi:4-phosphopantoate--beta-alanine ligase [Streptomyces cavernicola]|uniref:Pantothenate synthetase n=1 Tax=Streptomyces cavernicola TaxID=3043613 RepID=A0ABT6SMK5_9ACTN|nr:pantoate--beta-alanine ligase [Streptomyces sp. B-S-A6]MDI3408907.1 pantoate--beta-alanine ligase [Streptomyces sp. B-S-A6]
MPAFGERKELGSSLPHSARFHEDEGADRVIVVEERIGLAEMRVGWTGTVGLVITMGALHEGHASLIREARRLHDHVVVTVYVNPLQYEDPAVYPRTPDEDARLCREEGVDVLYMPDTAEVYRDGGPLITVAPGARGEVLEAEGRPGYFDGVLTVMLKMTNLVGPDAVFLGEKDFQQLALFRRMVFDLDVPVQVVGVPTVRESDGLALSSRNTRLSTAEREAALALPRALTAGVGVAAEQGGAADVLAAAANLLKAADSGDVPVRTLYLQLAGPSLESAPEQGPAWLLAAVQVGGTRLIDAMPLQLEPSSQSGG